MASSSATVEVFEDVGSSDRTDQELELQLQLETETAAPAAPGADLHSSDANPVAPVAPAAPAPAPAHSPAQPSDRDSDGHNEEEHEVAHDEQLTSTADTRQKQPSSGSAVHAHRVNHNSSKLPAFRLSDRARSLLPLPGLLQRDSKQHPPSSAGLSESPQHQDDRQKVTNPAPEPENRPGTNAAADDNADAQHLQHHQNHHLHRPVTVSAPASEPHPPSTQQPPPSTPHSPVTPRQKHSPARSRASTYQTASTSAPFTPTAASKRPAPFPVDSSPGDALAFQSPTDESPSFWTPETRPPTQPLNATPGSISAASPHASHHSQGIHTPESTTKKWAQGQRALASPAAVNGDKLHDSQAERRTSTSRPPVSYKPFRSSSNPSRPVIPPIRSFRSSGSRKSLQLDMHNSSYRSYDDGHDFKDSNHRDQSLRALEGRNSGEWTRDMSAADADDEVTATIESESTADIFMRIAHEDPPSSSSRTRNDGRDEDDRASTVSRVVRSARQRPLSTVIPSSFQNPTSPPRVPRRLSDQQDRASRVRRTTEDQPAQHTEREVPYRGSTTERPSLSLDATRARSTVSSLRPSPITPRTYGGLDNTAEGNSIFARRPATSEHPRKSSHRQPSGLSKSFQSSPLVPKIWDELDELKSRIHRLELTGKLPKTSGAAMSRASDERPPTAGTGATTVSGSPKRASANGAAQTEILSITSSHRDAQPILKSALSKTKPFVNSDIYNAVEAAANDAMSLSQMMGIVGQPGPISSGASTIGGSGQATVTDRLLRKKVDSMCRNLTELCLALTDEGSQRKAATQQPKPESRETVKPKEQEQLSSPPPIKVFTGAPRRETSKPDEPVPSVESSVSPRVTRLEKRATFNFTAPSVPSPRYAPSALGGEATTPGRKSSLVVARTRRGVTEEPDDQGRKTSLLRTRRAGTDEPEEGRKTSFLLPPRRVTTIARGSNIDEEQDSRFRAPSRAITEVAGLRVDVPSRDREDVTRGSFQMQEPTSASSALPRRRLITSNLPSASAASSRFATPTTPSSRRFLGADRFGQERGDRFDRADNNNVTERLAEERGQRQYS
ncbi:hypothetical protein INS49_006782 [Diaporthe citri]|uniref:uncharacterized protein n=1 Tax=Diaporthe citri TaxID=83186 RepID=UPI001C7E4FD3|nr:uncharacterized protein INS49_006782 [Diaporthe citri]KAG6365174.1 hypothetical protein INS49_006782 [Diaporthe citri]